ncbi:hypothetical protein Mame01_53390 [Microbispora amethystogenes]|nr:hypothetical protein Mame01_53390 [Microbispora amethystogenes]
MAPDVTDVLADVWSRRGRRGSAEAEALAVAAGLAVAVEAAPAAVAALPAFRGDVDARGGGLVLVSHAIHLVSVRLGAVLINTRQV